MNSMINWLAGERVINKRIENETRFANINIKMNIKHVEWTRARKYCQYLMCYVCTLHSLNWINYIQHLSYDWKQTNGIPSQKRYTESNLIHASGMLTIMCICKIIAQHCTYSNFYYLHSFTLFIVVVVVVSFQFSTQFQCDSFFFTIFWEFVFLFESWLNSEHENIKKKNYNDNNQTAFHYCPHAWHGTHIVCKPLKLHALSFILTFINVLTTVFVTTTTNKYN